jgi:hypothetical protein
MLGILYPLCLLFAVVALVILVVRPSRNKLVMASVGLALVALSFFVPVIVAGMT